MSRTLELWISLLAVGTVFVFGVLILGWGRPLGYVLHGWLIAMVAFLAAVCPDSIP